MPYKIEKRGGKFAVVNEDSGKVMGTHPTEEEAKKNLAALEANVEDAKKDFDAENERKLTQEEVSYTVLASSDAEVCAKCRWFEGEMCHIVQCHPLPIEAAGVCDRFEALPVEEPDTPGEELAEAIEELADALTGESDTDDEDSGLYEMAFEGKALFVTPTRTLIDRARTVLNGKPVQPGQTLLKDKAGRRYMFIITSNGYKDREKEHVATKALQEYVNACWTADNTAFVGQQDHYIWHARNLGSISDLKYADMWDGFLVELWRENGTALSKAFYNFVERHSDVRWGASHGFFAEQDGDTYTKIYKFETSTLPLAEAANLATLSEVLPVANKSKREELLQKLFDEQYGPGVISPDDMKLGTAHVAKKLQGVEVKSAPDADMQKQANASSFAQVAGLMNDLIEGMNAQEDRLQALEAHNKALAEEAGADLDELREAVDTLASQMKMIAEKVNAGPRLAARDMATALPVDSPEAVLVKQQLDEQNFEGYDPMWGDMKVKKEHK